MVPAPAFGPQRGSYDPSIPERRAPKLQVREELLNRTRRRAASRDGGKEHGYSVRPRGDRVGGGSAKNSEWKEDWYLADLEEDNAYIKKCRNGHTMRMTLQNARFELLFESGVVAMLMGFCREAISSIAAARERFCEFSIEVFTQRAGIDRTDFGEGWKLVARMSERQLGALLFLYLMSYGKPLISGLARSECDHWTAFRNEVIHQGQLPAPTKVHEYAQPVYDLIRRARSEGCRTPAQVRHYLRVHLGE